MPVLMSAGQFFEKEFQAQMYQVRNHQETDINFDTPQDYSLQKSRNAPKNTSNNHGFIVNNNYVFGQHSRQNLLLEIETNLYNTVEAPQTETEQLINPSNKMHPNSTNQTNEEEQLSSGVQQMNRLTKGVGERNVANRANEKLHLTLNNRNEKLSRTIMSSNNSFS